MLLPIARKRYKNKKSNVKVYPHSGLKIFIQKDLTIKGLCSLTHKQVEIMAAARLRILVEASVHLTPELIIGQSSSHLIWLKRCQDLFQFLALFFLERFIEVQLCIGSLVVWFNAHSSEERHHLFCRREKMSCAGQVGMSMRLSKGFW